MEIALAPNPLYTECQTLRVEKVAALIGENGSGKSSLLQSIFECGMDGNLNDTRVVCFSSGHNERFSKGFSKYLKQARRSKYGLDLHCFYYDKGWSDLLIFLASILKRDGKVRNLLKRLDLVIESEGLRDDVSTKLSMSFRIDRPFINKVKSALHKEEAGEVNTFRSNSFFRCLSSFIENAVDESYEFEDVLRQREIKIGSSEVLNTSFELPPHEKRSTFSTNDDPATVFFTQAIDANNPITKSSLHLTFNNGISLDDVSDGEYQLLFIYSLLDLFDSDNTLFLFDEADSHLHYKNISRLWSAIKKSDGKFLMTTHLLDSISEVGVENIQIVTKGKLVPYTDRKELQARLEQLSNINKAKLKTYALHERIVLMDNENDWDIFTRLLIRKMGDENKIAIIRKLKKFCCVAVESGYGAHTESFAAKKLKWLESFSSYLNGSNLATTHVYLICDRDNLPLPSIDQERLILNGGHDIINTAITASEINASILVWRRREIKHYLLSYSALKQKELTNKINNDSLGLACHLHKEMSGDYQCLVDEKSGAKAPIATQHLGENLEYNNGLALLSSAKIKNLVNPLINGDEYLDLIKLQSYIDLIPPSEISEDIINMYNFITENL